MEFAEFYLESFSNNKFFYSRFRRKARRYHGGAGNSGSVRNDVDSNSDNKLTLISVSFINSSHSPLFAIIKYYFSFCGHD